MAKEEYFVIVLANDEPHPIFGTDENGELILEMYTKNAKTKKEVEKIAKRFKLRGSYRIGRVTFD